MCNLASGWHIHFKYGLERLRLNCKHNFVSPDISFWLVWKENVGWKFIYWVLTDNRKWNFVIGIHNVLLACLFLIPLLLWNVYSLLRTDIWVWSNLNIELLTDCRQYLLFVLWLSILLAFLQTLNGFFRPIDLLIFGVNLELPIDYLINAQLHGRSDLRNSTWRLNTSNDLVLEFTNNGVQEKDSCFSCIETHGHIIKRQRNCSILTNLHIVLFTEYSLGLLLFWQKRRSIFVFPSRLKNILSLIRNWEIDHFSIGELIKDVNSKLNLFIEDPWNVPNSVASPADNLGLELEYKSCSSQRILLHVYKHYLPLDWRTDSWDKFNLEFIDFLWLNSKLLLADYFKVFTAFVTNLIGNCFAWRVSQLDCPYNLLAKNALEHHRLLLRHIEWQINIKVQNK